MIVHVLAGPSGAGKSTLAKQLLAEAHAAGLRAVVYSADDYFIDPSTGKYRFRAVNLPKAHAKCLRRFLTALADAAVDVAIVDNTNTTLVELAPYVQPALAFGAQVRISVLGMHRKAWELAARNVHGVSVDACIAMQGRMEVALAHWPARWPQPEVS